MLSTPPAFVLSQDQTLQTKPVQKNILKTSVPKNRQKQHHTPNTGRRRHGKKQQQTKTTKHTIEFSNNTSVPKNRQKQHHTPNTGRRRHGKKQQQTKTTKHTIEFSNNTPGFRQPRHSTA
ncbi:hypothetical protein H7K14_20405 [Mycolicibacter longobardus]|uniref:hypothetical protein n=1 Tax=Mycolicibacter longobardus TaxID=1108812 RepID=UPI0021F2F95B|nr:hypothetical protein [Mycolicibacter longobardus]MCV7386174.1 hypothetical protein [Mycolicibacter longobardus]